MPPTSATPPTSIVLRLGARGSLLSRMQSQAVARQLEAAHPHLRVDIVPIKTSGDIIQDRPLHELGGKGLFTRELELALLNGTVDFAVHSYKDVPVTMPLVSPANLIIAATPKREDPRDVLVSPTANHPADLPLNARIGTGSLRRQAQLLELRPDLRIEPIRGNIDTRLRKLAAGEYDAIILAAAGLLRANLFDPATMHPLDPATMLPAAGQGALALQCTADNAQVIALLSALNHPQTAAAVQAERAIVLGLQGDCHSPIAAHAQIIGNQMHLQAAVAKRGGTPPILRAQATAPANTLTAAAAQVLQQLTQQGAAQLLH